MSAMIHRTVQFRVYTTRAGYERIGELLNATRRLYNAALEERKAAVAQYYSRRFVWSDKRECYFEHSQRFTEIPKGAGVTHYDQMKQLTAIRADDPDGYGAIPVVFARGPLARINKAFAAFYARVKRGETPGYPRFKSHTRWHTLDPTEVTPGWFKPNGVLRIKGLPTIRLRKGVNWPEHKPVALKITLRGRRLTLSVTYVQPAPTYPAAVAPAVGIDMGVVDRLALSDGHRIPRRKRTRAARIRRAQQRLSSARKGSNTRRKRAAILANLHDHERIANRNEVHQITSAIVRRYQRIAIDNVLIPNMVRSAAGTMERPGRNVAAKRGLNRSIQEQTWGMIRAQLTYKAGWAGREVALVYSKHTSERCSACGVIDGSNRCGRRYACASCGMMLNADINAARNILLAAVWTGGSPAAGDDLDDP